jgi:hypothetical protein
MMHFFQFLLLNNLFEKYGISYILYERTVLLILFNSIYLFFIFIYFMFPILSIL